VPGNLPASGIVQMRLTWTLSGAPHALNILHFQNTGTPPYSQPRATAASAAIKALAGTSLLMAQLHPTIALHAVDFRDMTALSNPWLLGGGTPVAGTGTGNPLPAATSFCISIATGLRGRSYNGRIFFTGYTVAAMDPAGGITGTAANGTAGFADTMRINLATATHQLLMGVLSRWTTPPDAPPNTPPTERPDPLFVPATIATYRDLRWDVQRRRAVPGI
jgi:hypothetical protein